MHLSTKEGKLKKTKLSASAASALTISAFASQKAENFYVVVTSADALTQYMSMVLSTQAKEKGANVDILLCGQAADLALKDSKETLLKPQDKSPQMLMKNLINGGVKVEVCPPYLPNAGKSAEDLLEGVSVAKPPVVADKMLDKNTQILSY